MISSQARIKLDKITKREQSIVDEFAITVAKAVLPHMSEEQKERVLSGNFLMQFKRHQFESDTMLEAIFDGDLVATLIFERTDYPTKQGTKIRSVAKIKWEGKYISK